MNSDQYPTTDDEIKLWVIFYRAAYVIKRNRERELAKHGITWIQSSVLETIKKSEEPMTPTDIARKLFRQSHTISELIKRMEKQQLVQRLRDLKKKNVIRVLLTGKGEELLAKAHQNQVVHEILSVLEEKERNQLLQMMTSLLDKATETLNMSYYNSLSNYVIE
jgi:DNA-binding MarR family transcriptional regulator